MTVYYLVCIFLLVFCMCMCMCNNKCGYGWGNTSAIIKSLSCHHGYCNMLMQYQVNNKIYVSQLTVDNYDESDKYAKGKSLDILYYVDDPKSIYIECPKTTKDQYALSASCLILIVLLGFLINGVCSVFAIISGPQ